MDTLEKAELTTSIHHNARILKSGIPIYNSEVQIQLEEKQQEDEHKQNCKALCVSRKRKKPYELYCNGHGNRVFPWKWEEGLLKGERGLNGCVYLRREVVI